MKRKDKAIVVLSVAVLALASALGWVCSKVRTFNSTHGTDVFANLAAQDVRNVLDATKAAEGSADAGPNSEKAADESTNAVSETEEKKDLPPEMKVEEVTYEGGNVLRVRLSERPDMDVIRNYVRVDPLAEGVLSFRYGTSYNYREKKWEPLLSITGEFAFRTNVTLRLLKGLPLYGKGADAGAEGSLKEDFVYAFRRKDQDPHVKFAEAGRYLPPGGRRTVAIESVNVTNVLTMISRVEPANLVQLLAREEGEYRFHGKWSDGDGDLEDIDELAGQVFTNRLRCANAANVKERNELAMAVGDGGHRNGIYFVTARMADFPPCAYVGYWNKDATLNPDRHRVVCVSDMGLSVRAWRGDAIGVWVTSLTTGRPVANTEIAVYSTANIKVMEGVTDGNGWCVPERVGKGAPFAVVAISPNADDMTFMALKNSMRVDETYVDGAREKYLSGNETCAFLWTERGIYRHDEKIFVHAIFRDGTRSAPRPFPVEIRLLCPEEKIRFRSNAMTDANGAVFYDGFSVAADQPSGMWTLQVAVPGGDTVLGETKVKIEEFAPPQIRVKVEDDATRRFPGFDFTVSAEHLFGGPAHNLRCEGAVVFEDVPFAPAKWKGWRFGNDMLGLKPSFRRLKSEAGCLDRQGRLSFSAPLWADSGLPKAAVRATAQGTVFEDGGRPATARKSVVKHFYPYYIGSTLSGWMRLPKGGGAEISLACVTPEGGRLQKSRKLDVKIERIDSRYSYKKDARGWATWSCERVRKEVFAGVSVTTSTNGNTRYELPLKESGDYAISFTDAETGVSFGREFYLSDWGDDVVRAPLANPTEVTIVADKSFYRAGETPRLVVKSPFKGMALLSVMRDGFIYSEVLSLTNATSEIVLRPVAAEHAPNLDVYLSVVQGVDASSKRLAVRAHGQTTIGVRPVEGEITTSVAGKVDIGDDGSRVSVDFSAPDASEAVVTLVDEGINLLTGEETPDPVAFFARPRMAEHPLYDIYHRILPVYGEDGLKAGGVKTGGGFGAEMLSRVSPVPTRRFKPLALWRTKVPVVNGSGKVDFKLPVFVGEVRVTVVAYNGKATGSKSVQLKVTPRLVMMPDAPRFVAPDDRFDVSMPVYNRSGADGSFAFEIFSGEKKIAAGADIPMPKDSSTNIQVRVVAPGEPGEMELKYVSAGFGERHVSTLHLPVRPAVPWQETAGVKRLAAGEKFTPRPGRFRYREYDSPLGGLSRAIEWLCDYPHGCLEQTVSRVFPLISAGGILASVETRTKADRADVVKEGVERVKSMMRAHDFVMWPDANYPPWDRQVSLYASHFLISADRAGMKIGDATKSHVLRFLSKWATSTDDTVSAYAVHTLALAGRPDKDRMFRLYDGRRNLTLLSQVRLARAFAAIGDRGRAETLLANAAAPSGVMDAAFSLIAVLELNPDDPRALPLVKYLEDQRGRERCEWGTTERNAHALMAIGEYYRFHPPAKGERLAAWHRLELPKLGEVKAESNGISISRRFLSPEGAVLDAGKFAPGEMVISEIEITAPVEREYGDLVIEDLFAGAFEPVRNHTEKAADWVMRSDARDDRMLVFSKRFALKPGEKAVFRHPLRVVSSGEYTLPGISVEAMYFPALRARTAPARVRIAR